MTRLDWGMEAIAFMLWTGSLLFLILNFNTMQDSIPTHYDLTGKPDAFGGKHTLWILVGINTGLYLLLTWINSYPHLFNYSVEITPENAEQQYSLAVRMTRAMKIVVMLIFTYILFSSVSGDYLGVWFLPVFLLGIATVMSVYLFKAKQAARK